MSEEHRNCHSEDTVLDLRDRNAELELSCGKLWVYADHLRNCRHKSGDPFVNLHECTCGLRELYENCQV